MVVGVQRRRVGFKIHTLGKSLQKLSLIGTAASQTQRSFRWPALPSTAGGVLDKHHQEVASKRNTLGKTVLEFDQYVFQTAQLLRDISVQK